MSQIIYISHGGGPLPVLGDPSHRKMVDFLGDLAGKTGIPDEVLVISAHWEAVKPTVYSSENQKLLYDYYGFPSQAYDLTYPTSENLELVNTIEDAFKENAIDYKLDSERGLDHGVFIPLKLMFPNRLLPVTQLSLIKGLDPQTHIDLGESLKALNKRNILIIGSGFSFHNMRYFTMSDSPDKDQKNDDFQDWLIKVCSEEEDSSRRDLSLKNWQSAPNARYCHPREEHLLPLHVCSGISQSKADLVFDDYIAGKRAVAFYWKV